MRNLFIAIPIFLLATLARCRKVENVNLGSNYRIHNERGPRNRVIVGRYDIVKVNDHIVDFAYDSIFVTAAQLPWDSVPGIWKMTYKEGNKAIDESTFRQYWIIDKSRDKVYGPMEQARFDILCDSLNLRTSLRLKRN